MHMYRLECCHSMLADLVSVHAPFFWEVAYLQITVMFNTLLTKVVRRPLGIINAVHQPCELVAFLCHAWLQTFAG